MWIARRLEMCFYAVKLGPKLSSELHVVCGPVTAPTAFVNASDTKKNCAQAAKTSAKTLTSTK